MMLKKFIAAIMALACAAPVSAQSGEAPAIWDYSGPRAEVRGGWDRFGIDATISDGVDTESDSGDDSGISYGGEIGYDQQFGPSTVLGIYGGIEESGVGACGEAYGDDEACLKAGRSLTVGVRGGYLIGPRSLVYIKGGYVNTRASLGYTSTDPSENFRIGDDLDGFQAGVGVELNMGGRAYGKLEYVYSGYSGFGFGPDASGNSADLDFDRHQVLAGLGFHF